jgi:hypothetical protein
LGKTTTTNTQLNRVGTKLFGDQYVGTFPSDMIPRLDVGQYTIINLDDSTRSGSHWISLVKLKNGRVLVFDSYGRATRTILPSLTADYVESERDAEQTIKQTNCGAQSMSFIMVHHLKGFEYSKWI